MEDHNASEPDLTKLQANDHLAWNAAYDQLYRLGQMAVRLDGSQHTQDREDVITATITSVTKGVFENKFTDWQHMKHSFLTLLPMRKNDFLRKLYRSQEDSYDPAEIPEYGHQESVFESTTMTWDELCFYIELLDPPRRRNVFQWIFGQGLTAQQVTDQHGINRSTVLSDLRRGYETLRELITKR